MTAPAQTDFYAAFLHELNQPLTTLRNLLELTTYRESNDWPAVIESALHNVDRMVELLDLMGELSHFERMPVPSIPVDMAELLREALEDLGASAAVDGRTLTGSGVESPVWVMAAAGPLRSALFRILADAVHHMGEGQTVNVTLRICSGRPNENSLDAPASGPSAVICEIAYPEPGLAQNESEALLAMARTGRGTRGGITRRVFRLALCLRVLVLQGVRLEVLAGAKESWLLRLALPAAAREHPVD